MTASTSLGASQRHLAGCDNCAHYVEQMRLMLSQFAELRGQIERKDPLCL